jgi:DNA-binding XRE family transcriptional regulator
MFKELIEHFGSRKALCNELGVTRQALCQYEAQGYLPGLRAIEIEQKTKGKFKAADMVKQS